MSHSPTGPGRTLTTWVIVLLVVDVAVAVFAVDYLVFDLHSLYARSQGVPVAMELGQAHTRLVDMALAAVAALVATAVVWLAWQFRAHANLARLGARGMRFSPSGAVASWFLVPANVILPFMAVGELWKASNPEAGPEDWKAGRLGALVPPWWAGLLATAALVAVAYRMVWVPTPTVHRMIERDIFLVAASLVAVATAVVAVALVRQVDGRQFVKEHGKPSETWSRWRRA